MHGGDGDRPNILRDGRDGTAAELAAPAAVTHSCAEPAAPSACCEAARVPWDRVRNELGGDLRVLGDLAAAFCEEGPQLIAQMQAAAATGGGSALWQSAHTLKGSLQIFHADDLLHLAREIEVLGRTGHFSAAVELLPQLSAGVAELCREIAKRVLTEPRR